jgi:hypothetical protein
MDYKLNPLLLAALDMSLTPVEINYLGQAIAQFDLERQGFVWKWNTSIPGSTDIEATKGSEGRLVQVRTAVHPQEPRGLGQDETQRIKAKASQMGYEPWLVQITIKEGDSAAKTIIWTKLE